MKLSFVLKNVGYAAPVRIELQAKKTLDGDILIFDHIDVDIVVRPKKGTLMAFPKSSKMTEDAYVSEDRLFDFMVRRGIIDMESVQGGNVFGSLEGVILPSDKLDSIQATLYAISKFLDEERSYFDAVTGQQDKIDMMYTEPDGAHSTELGEIPQAQRKGSMTTPRPYRTAWFGHYI